MIDPKEFLNKQTQTKQEESDDSVQISGTFVCQECNEICNSARLNETKMKITWSCSNEHYSEARL
jgi:hypothetical protein